jgi:multicomponent Na+:H+ antiporter subunit A
MLPLILLHGVLALVIAAGDRRLRTRSFLVASIAPLATLVWAMANAGPILAGTPATTQLTWVPGLSLELDLAVDAYGLAFVALIGLAGLAIFLYSAGYFGPSPRTSRFAATMVAFAGAMLGIVASDHLLAVFLFWELTTVTSYLLIGHADTNAKARSAALHAALVTGAGGLAMLGGFVLLGEAAGTYRIGELLAAPPTGGAVSAAWALVLVGAATKSAQVPFHGWLPGAMAAPTPASAFLHSATMVKAGVFLVGRLAPAATAAVAWWQPTVIGIGLATMVVGGWRALRQTDLKLLLAHGTVSQLGFLFLLAGVGVPSLAYGAVALVLAHGLFKSTLFLTVGTIDGATGTRDLTRLEGLPRAMPFTVGAAVAAGISMAAVPLTFGFAAKEAAFDGLAGRGGPLIAAVAVISVLTVLYTARFLRGVVGAADPGVEPAAIAPVGGVRRWVPVGLAGIGVVLGFAPAIAAPLVDAAATAISGEAAGKLVIWPGFVPALWWSLGSLVVGAILATRADGIDRVLAAVGRAVSPLPDTEGTFRSSLRGLLRAADRSTGIVQSGSLPTYLTTIALVVVVVPGIALVRRLPDSPLPPVGPFVAIPFALAVGLAAVALLFTRRRFASVLLLGGVGYGIAALYVVFDGPDLALTQILVETLVIALFALVLRHLPARFDRPAATVARVAAAVSVAAFVFIAGLVAVGSRTDPAVSEYYATQAVPEAAGKNVVNVILVDFRALDTLGEITVLGVAALGVVALVIPLFGRKSPS